MPGGLSGLPGRIPAQHGLNLTRKWQEIHHKGEEGE
jgi:hypothetical protein